jgi:hypothetical protein
LTILGFPQKEVTYVNSTFCFADYVKMVNSFDASIKTEVIGVQTTKEDAAVVDSALAWLFPANTSGKFYVSFLQDTDDNILQVVYG